MAAVLARADMRTLDDLMCTSLKAAEAKPKTRYASAHQDCESAAGTEQSALSSLEMSATADKKDYLESVVNGAIRTFFRDT